jgi:CheY-like chemotaxis protein
MKQRILVVEDNEVNRELLCDWLETQGMEAIAAGNLEQAREALRSQSPAAVLLDVQLGQEDGLELAAWVRQGSERSDLLLIAVTAHAMMTDQERVLLAGCNACIPKPIDFRLLRKHLQQYLDR